MITLSGHQFRVVVAGTGTPIVALHGFPDSAELWRYQMGPLADAGFQVIAPDLRGFGKSWMPQEVENYKPVKLLSDIVGIMHHFRIRRAHVVGHDFGAFLAWTLAALMPRRVDRLAVMSVGHPAVWSYLSMEQRRRFWYALLFLLPEAEMIVRQRNWELIRQMFDGERDRDRFLRDLRRPGALTAGLNWYRANCHPADELNGSRAMPAVAAPTLALWGPGDEALTEEAMLQSERYVTGEWKYERIEGAGHYIPVDAPGTVTELLLSWFASRRSVPEPVGRLRRTGRR